MSTSLTPYELLELMVERINWRNENEKNGALESIVQWRQMGLFGNLVYAALCEHERTSERYKGTKQCLDCGRIL